MLADIYLSVRRQTFVWVDPGKFHHEDFSAHTNGETVFVCEHADGSLAGFLSLWPEDDFIHMLYIRSESRAAARHGAAPGAAGMAAA